MNCLEIASTLSQLPNFPGTKKDVASFLSNSSASDATAKVNPRQEHRPSPAEQHSDGRGLFPFKFMPPSAATAELPRQTPADPGSRSPGAGVRGGGARRAERPSPRVREAAAPPRSPKSRAGIFVGGKR